MGGNFLLKNIINEVGKYINFIFFKARIKLKTKIKNLKIKKIKI
jgi:hypothetical protein